MFKMISYEQLRYFRERVVPSEIGVPLPLFYKIKNDENLKRFKSSLEPYGATLEEREIDGYGKKWCLTLLPKTYRNFLYRGERGDKINGLYMPDFFDRAVERGGVGHFPDAVPTSWDPTSALASADKDGGVWVIDPTSLLHLKTGYGYAMYFSEEEICFKQLISLRYIKYLITSEKNRSEILRRYKGKNPFSRSLERLIIGVPEKYEDFVDPVLSFIIYINLKSKPTEIDTRSYAYHPRNLLLKNKIQLSNKK